MPASIDVAADDLPPAGDYFHGPVPLMSRALVAALSARDDIVLQAVPALCAARDDLCVVNIVGLSSIAHAVADLDAATLSNDDRSTLERLRPQLVARAGATAPPTLSRLAEGNKPIVVSDAVWEVVRSFGNVDRLGVERVGSVTGTTLSNYLHDAVS